MYFITRESKKSYPYPKKIRIFAITFHVILFNIIRNKNLIHNKKTQMNKLLFIPILAALAITVGCTSQRPTAVQQPLPQEGQVWQLVAVQGRTVGRTANVATLSFNPKTGRIRGFAHCNEYYANYHAAANGNFSIDSLSNGTVYCPEPLMNAEQRYLALLKKVTAYSIEGYTLTFYSRGKETLKYEMQ